MLAYCWPIVYDHGSAVKQHWLKVSYLQGTTVTQYPDTMLVQCWKSVIDDGTTFNQHWVSASQKEAVTSAERKYILDLQVNKYGFLAALWQEETGRQLQTFVWKTSLKVCRVDKLKIAQLSLTDGCYQNHESAFLL